MSYGSLELFYGGLEGLIGPPILTEGRILTTMEREHCSEADAEVPFTSSNGMQTISSTEWEFVDRPDLTIAYAERGGDFRTSHPEWCGAVRSNPPHPPSDDTL